MREIVDLNCDMGEDFGQWMLKDAPDEQVMALVSSANIAAGFHAGDPNTMDRVVKLAHDYGVGLGAHPGYFDLRGFGRRHIKMTSKELLNDIVYQIGAIREFCRRHGASLQHVKPHGALYMEVAINEELSKMIVDFLVGTDEDVILFCMKDSKIYQFAEQAGHPVICEFYADRDYDNSGSIVFKRRVDRLDPLAVAKKCVKACKTGMVTTIEGDEIEIYFESICFHSDTPGALEIGRAIRSGLDEAGVTVAPAAAILGQLKQK